MFTAQAGVKDVSVILHKISDSKTNKTNRTKRWERKKKKKKQRED